MLLLGDCVRVMQSIRSNSVDTILTDPPYGLEFMGKDWDSPGRAWTSGATFSHLGIGERERPVPSFSAMSPHGSCNPTCAVCGGRLRGKKKCICQKPLWKPIGKRRNKECEDHPDDVTSSGKLTAMRRLQAFHLDWASEALRIAKPGAFLLAFGGTRTSHRLACALEDAGWIIRDTICWLYGSGFPKSLDIGKVIDKAAGEEREVIGYSRGVVVTDSQGFGGIARGAFGIKQEGADIRVTIPATDAAKTWDGWGTALKPAWEPIIVAMKPCDGTFADNAVKHGVAGLWIEGGRVEGPNGDGVWGTKQETCQSTFNASPDNAHYRTEKHALGRWPANVLLGCSCETDQHEDPDCPVRMLDAQAGPQKSGGTPARRDAPRTKIAYGVYGDGGTPNGIGATSGNVSRFFYTAKASRSERERGLLGHLPCVVCGGLDTKTHITRDGREVNCFRNDHPTVKPISLMHYLARLTKTPTGGVVLDPFCGSGTTAIACLLEGRQFLGIDQDEHYLRIAKARIEAHSSTAKTKQLNLGI